MNQKKIKLLLIEDDLIDQMAFKRMVQRKQLPYEYDMVGSVAAAKSILLEKIYDVVITDYNLGDGTAFDIFEFIVDTPFIFTTGAGDEKVAVKAITSGAFYYHIKDPERNYLELLPISINKALREKYLEEIQKQSEKAIKESEVKFRAISSAASDAIIVLDYDGLVKFWNRAAEKIFGYSKTEIIDHNLDNLIVPEDPNNHFLKGLKYHWKKGINSALGERVAMKAQTKTGKIIYIELSISAVKIQDQLNSIVIIRDITTSKEAEEQLRRSKEKLDIILHNIGNGVIAIDSEQNIMFSNNKSFSLLGWLERPTNVKDLKSLLVNCEKQGKVLLASLNKNSFRNLELTVVNPFQRVLYVTATPFRNNAGQKDGKIFILADVTKEKEIETMKTDFVSSVTHELTNSHHFYKGIYQNHADE